MKLLKKGIISLFIAFLTVAPVLNVAGPWEQKAKAADTSTSDVPAPPEEIEDLTKTFEPGNGNASISSDGKAVSLATGYYQAGSIFANYKLNLSKDFTLGAYLYFGKTDPDSKFADGITFTMHNDSRGITALGDDGQALGAYSWDGSYIQNALSFEYDSYFNNSDLDAYDQNLIENTYGHTAFVTPQNLGKLEAQPHNAVSYMTEQIADGSWKKLSIHWDATNHKFTYTFNGVSNSYVIDPNTTFGSNEVYWGFTGSTGHRTGAHDFLIGINELPQQHKVTAHYVDKKTGQKLKDDYSVNVTEGNTYSIPNDEIADYTYDSSSDPLTGTMGMQDREVTLYYNKKENHKLTVHYVDKDTGETVHTDYVANVKEGDAYTAPKETIADYTYDSSSDSLTGTMGSVDKEITLYYTKNIAEHKLTAHYVDKETGKQIHADYTATVKEGDSYSVPKETITDYTYNSSSESLTGTMGTGDKDITVYYDRVLKGTVTADDFIIGEDWTVTGTYTGDVHKLVIMIDGKMSGQKFPTSSPYSLYVGSTKILDTNQNVEVVAYDINGKELDRAKVNLIKSGGVLSPNTFKVGTDSYITGTYTGTITKVQLYVDGVYTGKTIPVKDGKINYYARDVVTSIDQNVELVGLSKNGVELDRKPVQLVAGSGTITADEYKVGSSYITGTSTGDVAKVRISVDGVEKTSIVVVNPDGTFKYYVGGLNLTADSKVEVIGYSSNYEELDRDAVPIIGASGTISADTFNVGDYYVTGTATGDVTKVTISVDGKAYPNALTLVKSDGTYSYFVNDKNIKAGSQVEVIGLSARGEELSRATVKVVDLTGTITPDSYKVGTSYITGKVTGNVKRVGLKVDGTTLTSFTVVNADGTFRYYAKDKGITEASKVEVIGMDDSNTVFAQANVVLTK
ncbi:immunoglobulin-like domain-containing protein [Listeria aquatica]|uniref:MucBP domain protein n=1 Tax=Listeria aquatica FSL S10-1188 TaxID=1265818 RepID=W7BLY3_9LIST|nr:immunoglobulin-like domain-containing protein [Listeria aquatica]EUJ20978.1 MucBP domain protein [Listeria aquatica FSL S10-1188]